MPTLATSKAHSAKSAAMKAADQKLADDAEDRVDWATAHDTDDNPNGTPRKDDEIS